MRRSLRAWKKTFLNPTGYSRPINVDEFGSFAGSQIKFIRSHPLTLEDRKFIVKSVLLRMLQMLQMVYAISVNSVNNHFLYTKSKRDKWLSSIREAGLEEISLSPSGRGGHRALATSKGEETQALIHSAREQNRALVQASGGFFRHGGVIHRHISCNVESYCCILWDQPELRPRLTPWRLPQAST